MDAEQLDTTNLYLIGVHGTGALVSLRLGQTFTEAEALNLAAWLVTMVDPDQLKFKPLLAAIRST